jgi:site-specific recombinase XerD
MEKNESVEQFRKWLERRYPGRRTAKDYVSDVKQFMGCTEKELRAVRMHDIDAFVDQQRKQGLKMTTVNRRVAALKTFFDFLAEESDDAQWVNPVRYKRHAGKRGRRLARDLHDEQIEQVWGAIKTARDRAWFALMVRGGLRVGEVVGLEVADVERAPLENGPARLRVKGKGQKERMICLSADAYAILESWLAERGERAEPGIFLNEKGNRLSSNGIEWLLHGYGRAVGIDLTPHQLRHTYARQLTEAGMPVTSLSKLLGHAQITTTQIYTAGADPDLAQAYQQAMGRLEQPGHSVTASKAAPPQILKPEEQAGKLAAPKVVPQPPDWQAWGKHLPPAIQQASVEYVQHLWGAWPERRRHTNALQALNELGHLWDWFVGHRPLTHPGQVSLKDLHAYQTAQVQKGYAAGTINRRFDHMLGLLRRLAERDEPVDNSVFRLRYLRRPDSLPRHLSEAEARRLETYLNGRMDSPDPLVRLENSCLFLLLHSGLRSGECADLLFQDLDLPGQRLIIRQGKGQKDRLVCLSEHTVLALQLYLQGTSHRPDDPLWRYASGRPMSIYWLRDHVADLGKAAGIENLYPHRLRHTCATRLLNAGMDITRIQKLLGHEMLATTMIYARVQDATLERDYRQAMALIERQQMPLSSGPISVGDWPNKVVKVHVAIDDSV